MRAPNLSSGRNAFVLACVAVAACQQEAPRPAPKQAQKQIRQPVIEAPLVQAIGVELRKLNPALTGAQLLGVLQAFDSDGARYVALAVATAPGHSFTDVRHAGEVFAVFTVNAQLDRPTRLLGYFISPRTYDYDAWILEAAGDSVIICGRGESYGDEAKRWAFGLDPEHYGHEKPDPADTSSALLSGDPNPSPKRCQGAASWLR
jgi:hypothetical protein